jgi:hypothetical protein
MNQMNLTSDEAALIAKVTKNGYAITSIEKSEIEFRVHYKAFGGSGSHAIVYQLAASMLQTVAKIKELEKAIA